MVVHRWEIPSSVDVDRLVGQLGRDWRLTPEAPSRLRRVYYDSFDGRLWRAGWTLTLERAPRRGLWRLQSREPFELPQPVTPLAKVGRADDATAARTMVVARARSSMARPVASGRLAPPAAEPDPLPIEWWGEPCNPQEAWMRRLVARCGLRAHALPSGELRDRVAPLLSVRALLPLVEARSVEQRLTGRGRGGAGCGCITVTCSRLHDGGRRSLPVAELLLTDEEGDGAHGVAKAFPADIERWFARAGIVPSTKDRLASWLERLDRPVVAARWRRHQPLEPHMRADVAERLALRGLRNVILANIPGAVAELDVEFLHDLRVAVRRTRSVLGRLRDVLPARSRERFKRELRWFGQLSGPARDFDVYLIGLDALDATFPAPLRSGLPPIRQWLSRRRAQHYERIRRALRSKRGRRLFTDWDAFIDRAPPRRPLATSARRPIRVVAGAEIWRAWRKAMRQGRRIVEASTATELHELRKTCKKLRYLLELFGRLVAPAVVDVVVGPLKGLQRALGEVQDIEVQSALLAELSAGLARKPVAPPEAWQALDAIRRALHERKHQARRLVAPAFEPLTDSSLRATVRSAFRPSPDR